MVEEAEVRHFLTSYVAAQYTIIVARTHTLKLASNIFTDTFRGERYERSEVNPISLTVAVSAHIGTL